MEKLNRKPLVVSMVLLVCLLIVGTTPSNKLALAVHPEASGVQVGQPQAVVGSGFTYQGSLKSGGSPANGQYDFQFTMYDALAGGSLAADPITIANVTVANGLFTVTLNFDPSAFQGEARYLEIAVHQTGGGTYTTLAPRQALTPAPYALGLRPGAVISGTTGILLTASNPGSGIGLLGSSATGVGVYGESTDSDGVFGQSLNGAGISAFSVLFEGMRGQTGSNYPGVYGKNFGTGNIGPGVRGDSTNGPGVYGFSDNSYAGYFQGNVRITGSCCSSSAGTYQIDDPLDPANKYLSQSAVESAEMKTIYDGIATLDGMGEVWVDLPGYAQSLNQNFRYQLTPIGAPARDLYIAQEIQNNRFKIAGGSASMKVSWQVTGIRHDPYAEQHPVVIEQDKPASEQGKYLHPEAYGQPEALGIGYEQSQSVNQATQPVSPTKSGR